MVSEISPEVSQNFIEQAVNLWINPEIKRRREARLLPDEFDLYAVQIIMNFDSPIEVRFNVEVKADVKGNFTKTFTEGEQVSLDDLESIEAIELTSNDPNAGHFTALRYKGGWHAQFDFRYNAARSLQRLEAAREFLDSAAFSLAEKKLRVVVDNLFSATELMAIGLLLMHDQAMMKKGSHGTVHSKYNLWGKLGNTNSRYTKLLNKVADLRPIARYLQKDFTLTIEEAKDMLDTAESMYSDLNARIPKRQ